MKKLILLFGIFLVFMSRSFAQLNQTELTPILQDAKDFAEKSNQEGFEYSIEQFANWLEVKTLKPQSLNQTNRTLLISALKSAFNNDIIKDSNKHLTLFFEFLKYESENNDNEENWHWLGYLYDMGYGIAQNYTIAKYWYEKAIEKGKATSMNNLGYMYDEGHGITQNFTTAKYWYEKAAERGEATAMNNLGYMYKNGNGVTQNYSTAKYWYEKAIEKGSVASMYWLGVMFYDGLGVTQNFTTAKYWYEKAAEKGEARAMNNLGNMYKEGNGVTQNYTTAKYWYEKASERGNEVAKKMVTELESLLNKNEEINTSSSETITYDNGDKYIGYVKNGKKNGYGVYFWKDNSTYIGYFSEDNITGKGQLNFANGNISVGTFENSILIAGKRSSFTTVMMLETDPNSQKVPLYEFGEFNNEGKLLNGFALFNVGEIYISSIYKNGVMEIGLSKTKKEVDELENQFDQIYKLDKKIINN